MKILYGYVVIYKVVDSIRVFAFKNIDILDSSSGAAFPTIIETIKTIYNDSPLIVYGAKFDDEFNVVHARAETEDEYKKNRGSKYVQSSLGNVFEDVCSDLINEKNVLFTGTPCQVYGLKNFLDRRNINTSKLFLVDIICHGTPDQKIWKDFVLWIEKKRKSKLKEFSFRYQKAKWKSYPVMATFVNGKKDINSHIVRLYTKLFLRNLIMREGCYSCKFASRNRISDITLGDFWGIEKVLPNFIYKENVSQILVNTDKGNVIIQEILNMQTENILIEECFSDDYMKYQHNLNGPTIKPKCVEQLRKEYNTKGIEFVLKKYAGYNIIGKIKHIVSRFLGEII